jgi:hypothetical protein
MSIGQAYADILTPREQQALAEACDWLIDHAFDERERVEKPQDVLDSVVGEYLPTRYVYRYTPHFYKKFAVCVITVAWKLAQSEYMRLSSLAEELAARAIIQDVFVNDIGGQFRLCCTLRDGRQPIVPSCGLRWSNHAQEFILSAIGVVQKRGEGSEAGVLVEANSSCVEGCHAQAPRSDGKVFLTKGQPCIEERSPQAFACQIWPQT